MTPERQAYMTRYRAEHRSELNARHRAYDAQHRQHIRDLNKRYYAEKGQARQRQRLYGVTAFEFEAQISKQNGLCPIGNHPFGRGKLAPCQDHDHRTGKNRMILCCAHNSALGMFHESESELQDAIEYIRKHKVSI